MGFAERVLQGLAALGFAMDQPGLFFAPGEALVITHEFAVIGVAREGIERLNAGPDADAFAEYVDLGGIRLTGPAYMTMPPSTTSTCPVTYRAPGLARNAAA